MDYYLIIIIVVVIQIIMFKAITAIARTVLIGDFIIKRQNSAFKDFLLSKIDFVC